MLNFTFDGGTIQEHALIRLQADELEQCAFLPWNEVAGRLPANTAPHIGAVLRARNDHRTVYLPAGWD